MSAAFDRQFTLQVAILNGESAIHCFNSRYPFTSANRSVARSDTVA